MALPSFSGFPNLGSLQTYDDVVRVADTIVSNISKERLYEELNAYYAFYASSGVLSAFKPNGVLYHYLQKVIALNSIDFNSHLVLDVCKIVRNHFDIPVDYIPAFLILRETLALLVSVRNTVERLGLKKDEDVSHILKVLSNRAIELINRGGSVNDAYRLTETDLGNVIRLVDMFRLLE